MIAAPVSVVRPKRIYIAQRNASLSRDAFVARWRQHGKLAMSFMAAQGWRNVARYVHCDALHDHGIAGVSDRHDGMGILWFHDSEARKRHLGFAQARAALEADEKETFISAMKHGLGVVTREDVRLPGSTAGVKMIYCSALRDRRRRDAVAAYADRRCDDVLESFSSLRRYAQSFPLPPENGVSWGLDCDLIEELWFDDVPALQAAYANPRALALHMDDAAPALTAIALVVREILLYEAPA